MKIGIPLLRFTSYQYSQIMKTTFLGNRPKQYKPSTTWLTDLHVNYIVALITTRPYVRCALFRISTGKNRHLSSNKRNQRNAQIRLPKKKVWSVIVHPLARFSVPFIFPSLFFFLLLPKLSRTIYDNGDDNHINEDNCLSAFIPSMVHIYRYVE